MGNKPRFCITLETNAQIEKATKARLIYALIMAQIVNRNDLPMKIGLKKQQLRIIVETTLEFKISVKTSAFVIALKEGMIGR